MTTQRSTRIGHGFGQIEGAARPKGSLRRRILLPSTIQAQHGGVVIDVRMAGMSGLDLLKSLKERTSSLPVS